MTGGGKRRLTIGMSLLILLGVFLVAVRNTRPAAPRTLQLLAGPEGTSYDDYAQQYAEFLVQKGLATEVVETAGSIDNLKRLLDDGPPAMAFVQSGIESHLGDAVADGALVSLGSVGFEPAWLFHRSDVAIESIGDLAGMRVILGAPGSGSRAIAQRLLGAYEIESDIIEITTEDQTPASAVQALRDGSADAGFFLGGARSQIIEELLESDDLQPAPVARAEAFTRRNQDLAALVLPEGAVDLAQNIPPQDLTLVAPATNIVTREAMHPAVVQLLIDAGTEVHYPQTLFVEPGTFPSARYTSLPLDPAAKHFYKNGASPLRKVLPYRLATLVDWLLVVVVPVAGVAFALFKLVPLMVQLRFRLKLLGYYKKLQKLEQDHAHGGDVGELDRRIREIEDNTVDLSAPRQLLSTYFEFRQNLFDMRERLGVTRQDGEVDEDTKPA